MAGHRASGSSDGTESKDWPCPRSSRGGRRGRATRSFDRTAGSPSWVASSTSRLIRAAGSEAERARSQVAEVASARARLRARESSRGFLGARDRVQLRVLGGSAGMAVGRSGRSGRLSRSSVNAEQRMQRSRPRPARTRSRATDRRLRHGPRNRLSAADPGCRGIGSNGVDRTRCTRSSRGQRRPPPRTDGMTQHLIASRDRATVRASGGVGQEEGLAWPRPSANPRPSCGAGTTPWPASASSSSSHFCWKSRQVMTLASPTRLSTFRLIDSLIPRVFSLQQWTPRLLRSSASWARARCSQVLTVPTGREMDSAISS